MTVNINLLRRPSWMGLKPEVNQLLMSIQWLLSEGSVSSWDVVETDRHTWTSTNIVLCVAFQRRSVFKTARRHLIVRVVSCRSSQGQPTLSLAVRKRGSSWNASFTSLLKRLNRVSSCSTYFSESWMNTHRMKGASVHFPLKSEIRDEGAAILP